MNSDTPSIFTDQDILSAQRQGMDIRENPKSLLPDIPPSPVPPSLNQSLISALLGVKAGMDASSSVNHLGDPFLSAIASAAGTITAPSAAEIMSARNAALASDRIKQLETMPVEQVAPKLVEAYPELKGVPLGIVSKFSPILESHARRSRENLPITEEMIKNYPGVAKLGYQVGQEIPITVLNNSMKEKDGIVLSEREKQIDSRNWIALGKEANLQNASSRKPLGMAVINNMKAGRGLKLLDTDKTYTPQDESLVTTDLTAIMKGGSPDEELLRQQQYGSFYKSGIALLQKITGNPEALNDPQVRQHLREVINGIREIDNEAIKNHFDSLESTFMETIANHPNEWDKYKARQMKFIGLDPSGISQNMGGAVKKIGSQEEYDALPKGTRYQDSQGNMAVKQ